MRNDSFSIKFYLDKDKQLNGGQYPIYIRVMINRKKVEISTRLHVEKESDWNVESQRLNSKSPINSHLNQMEGQLINLYQEMKHGKKHLSALNLKNQFLGRGASYTVLTDYFHSTLEERLKKNTELAPSTIRNYITTFSHLNLFLESAKLKSITLQEVDDAFVRKFDSFLLEKNIVNSITRTLHRTTVNKYHTKLKALFSIAVEENLIPRNPYYKFRMKKQESKRTFLTKPELDRIEADDLGGNKSLIISRDKFLFSVYTGLRFTDADNLIDENIESDGTKYWINFRQQKTKELLRIPMLNKAKEIYDKYEFERLTTGYVLPRLTNQKVNVYLKAIASMSF